MLGQGNIRKRVAVDQMGVDEPPTGEQHCEDNLSSEFEGKLHCGSQESSGSSSVSSDSQHSESTSGELVMEIDNAASKIKEAADFPHCRSQENPGPSSANSDSQHSESVIETANAASDKVIIEEVAKCFAQIFVKKFEQKVRKYSEEAEPNSGDRKSGKFSAMADSVIKSSVGPGLLPPSVDPISGGGQVLYTVPKKVVDSYLGERHRRKAKVISKVIHSFKCNQREVLIKAGLEIFQKFEKQFTKVIDVGKYIQGGSEERAIQKLAIDAVHRVMEYASDDSNVEESFFDFITKGVVLGKSKRETLAKSLHLRSAGCKMRDRQSGKIWLSSELYKSVGIKKIEGDVTKYYKLKKHDCAGKYGYRLAFGWELKNWQKIEQKYKPVERYEEEPKSILDKKEIKKIFSDVLKEIGGQDLVTMKTMVGIEDHLRRQDEDRSQFSYSFSEVVKFFIERKKVIKELDLKLHSKSQEIKMSRIVLIHGESGVGKTEFVRGYGFRGRCYSTWEKIMWIDALGYSSLKESFIALAEKLKIPTKIESEGRRDMDIESIVKGVYERLQYTKSFFVFDRASSYEEIKKFLPADSPSFLNKEKPFIVITCKNDWQEEDMKKVKLGDFDPKESDEFLREALGEGVSQDDISKLGKALNYHPLSLSQAAANINQGGNIGSYLKKCKVMQQLSGLQDDYEKLFEILKINIDKIKEEEKQAYAILEFMTYLNSYPINVKEIFFPGKSEENQQKISDALGRLDSYSLIRLEEGIAQIHQTTQEFMRLRQEEEGKEEETLRKIIISLRNSDTTTTSHIISVWNHVSKYKRLVNDFVNLAYHKGDTILHLLAKGGNEEIIRLILEKIDQDELSEVINTTNKTGFSPVYYAIIDNNLEIVKYFCKRRAELTVNDESGIKCAAISGSLKVVKYFINKGYFKLDELDEEGENPLIYAIEFDQLSVIKYLIKKGAAVNSLDDEEIMHLFHYAYQPDNLDIAQCLVRNLNGVNLCDEDGGSLLHYAAMYGSSDIVEYLVENGANVNLPDRHDEKSPLCYALMSGDLDIVECLVQNGANVNLPDHDGKSPLYYAVTSGYLDIVKCLVQNGANVNLRDENIITLLFCAIEDGALNIIECLVEIGIDVNQYNNAQYISPLRCAATYGDLDIVKYLLQNGANVDLHDENIMTLLFCAVKDGALNIIECLVEIGVDINQCNTDHISPLHYAAEKGRLNVVKFLIERKADLNLQDKKGGSPLHYAIQADHFNTARYLLIKGANIDLVDKDNHNPLYFTTFSNILAILCPLWQEVDVTPFNNGISFLSLLNVKCLIEMGINVNQYDKHDMNLLHYATQNGNLDIIEYLIRQGANVNACGGKCGVSPLHCAAVGGHLNIVEKLIEAGANVNACDKYGASPLHYAARMGHFDVVVYLVKSKADINLLDEYSKKPLNYSIENGYSNITDYLRAQEGNVNPAHEQSQRKRPRVSELQDCTLPYSVSGQCVSSKRRRLENIRATSLDNQEAVNPSLDTTTSLITLGLKLQHVLSHYGDKMQDFTQLGNGDSREPQQPVDNSVPISSLSGIVIEPGNNKVSVQPIGIRDNKPLYHSQ